MIFRMAYQQIITFMLIAFSIAGCVSAPAATVSPPIQKSAEPTPFSTSTQKSAEPTSVSPTIPLASATADAQPSVTTKLTGYEFPASIDPAKRYMFYLHGRIIEDQGLPAISPDFGEYEYEAILKKLATYGLIVISEQRSKDTDGFAYAQKIVRQITQLLDAKVPSQQITVVGASKGAAIAATVSYLLKNQKTNFVLLGTCHPDTVKEWKQNQITFYGNILAIYDSVDTEYSGSCQEIFELSTGKGLARHDEIVLHIGTGHGILYKPLDAWILPTVNWASQ